MRTILDLPDPLMHELKARAAHEGLTLKDYFAEIVQAALQRPLSSGLPSARSPLPVFERAGAKAMPAMTNAELYAILDDKDLR